MRHSTKKHQQGAIGLFGILTLMMVVLFVAVVVDSGRLWMEKRKLQNIADMAAIAAGGQVGGCLQSSNQAYRTAAQRAAEANGYHGNLLTAPNIVQLGGYTVDSVGVRNFVANNERRVVHVVATQEVPSSLLAGGIFNQRVVLQAEALAAIRTPFAAFSVGATTLSLDTADSKLLNLLLTQTLGTNVNLSLVSWQGIADSRVALLNLVYANPSIGSIQSLLDTNVTLGQFFSLIHAAASKNDNNLNLIANSVVLDDLLKFTTSTVNNLSVRVGDVLKVTNPDPNAVLTTQLNVLQLINTAVMVANKSHAIDLPLGVNLLGLANISSRIRVIEPPQMVIGPAPRAGESICTIAKTANIRVDTTVKTDSLLALLASVDLNLGVEVSTGTAELRSIVLNGGNTEVVIGATPGLLKTRLTNANVARNGPGTERAKINVLNLLFIPILSVEADLKLDASPAPKELLFQVSNPIAYEGSTHQAAFNNCVANQLLPECMRTYAGLGGSLHGLTQNGSGLKLYVCILGGICTEKLLGDILNSTLSTVVNGLVIPLIATVTQVIVDPLLKLLGINTAGITVVLDDVQSGNKQSLLR